jgi:hypothetical protein
MASHPYTTSGMPVSGAVDPAYWAQDLSDSSPVTLQLSPAPSSTTQASSVQSQTSPVQTPRSDSGISVQNGAGGQSNGQNSQNGQSNLQNGQSTAQNRASVAVACVPCRSRHLKCDGGVRCTRCRNEGVDCTYIKSRRGWKGKRKRPGENGIISTTILAANCDLTSEQCKKPMPYSRAM